MSTYAKFIILSRGRTGSSLLQFLLDSHPNVLCMGEMFAGKGLPALPNSYPRNRLPHMERKYSCTSLDNVDLLKSHIFIDYSDGIKAVGLRIAYYHAVNDPLWEYLMEQDDVLVVHLTRRNVFRMLVSWEIAKATGRWIEYWSTTNTPPTRIPVNISKECCREFFTLVEAERIRARSMFTGERIIDICYEEFASAPEESPAVQKVLEFLRLPVRPLSVMTRRQNPEQLSELVENFDELSDEFARTRWAHYFSDLGAV